MVACAWDALFNHSTAGAGYAPIAMLRNRRAAAHADQILYVTEKFLQQRYPSKAFQVACSDVEVKPVSKKDWEARASTFIEGRAAQIGICGNADVGYKGIDTALSAIKRLVERGFDAQLQVLGGGEGVRVRKIAERLGVGDRLHLKGSLPTGEPVFAWMDSLDQYWQPSRQEGLPRALIEAMGRGVPALGSTAGGIPELLPKNRVHPPCAFASLADISSEMIQSSKLQRSASHEGWVRSHDYDKAKLDDRRDSFWSTVREAAGRKH
jgi:glycosyltransferase involved in cell wall biosynthesis